MSRLTHALAAAGGAVVGIGAMVAIGTAHPSTIRLDTRDSTATGSASCTLTDRNGSRVYPFTSGVNLIVPADHAVCTVVSDGPGYVTLTATTSSGASETSRATPTSTGGVSV